MHKLEVVPVWLSPTMAAKVQEKFSHIEQSYFLKHFERIMGRLVL